MQSSASCALYCCDKFLPILWEFWLSDLIRTSTQVHREIYSLRQLPHIGDRLRTRKGKLCWRRTPYHTFKFGSGCGQSAFWQVFDCFSLKNSIHHGQAEDSPVIVFPLIWSRPVSAAPPPSIPSTRLLIASVIASWPWGRSLRPSRPSNSTPQYLERQCNCHRSTRSNPMLGLPWRMPIFP